MFDEEEMESSLWWIENSDEYNPVPDEPEMIYNEPVDAKDRYSMFKRQNKVILDYLEQVYKEKDFLEYLHEVLKQVVQTNPNYKPEDYSRFIAYKLWYQEKEAFVEDLLGYLLTSIKIRMHYRHYKSAEPINFVLFQEEILPYLTEFVAIIIYSKLKSFEGYDTKEEYEKQSHKLRDAFQSVGIAYYRFAIGQRYWFYGKLIEVKELKGDRDRRFAVLELADPLGQHLTLNARTPVYLKKKDTIWSANGAQVCVFGKVRWSYYHKRNILELEDIVKHFQPPPRIQSRSLREVYQKMNE